MTCKPRLFGNTRQIRTEHRENTNPILERRWIMKHGRHQPNSSTHGPKPYRVLTGAVVLVGLWAAGGCRGAADAQPMSSRPRLGPPAHEYELFGYYSARPTYDQNFQVKDIARTGMADRLTVLAYAFENIDPTNLTCSMTTKPVNNRDADPDQGTGGGDQYTDYNKPFDARSSVDGVADPPPDVVPAHGVPLRGNFNQLKMLKGKFPKLKIVVSLGGWTYSKFFSDVAASEASRRKFVSSCIDLYIKGNLPLYHGNGGPGSAANIFDGFDIDWEWPASDAHPGNHHTPADKANYALLLREFRRQLDASAEADITS